MPLDLQPMTLTPPCTTAPRVVRHHVMPVLLWVKSLVILHYVTKLVSVSTHFLHIAFFVVSVGDKAIDKSLLNFALALLEGLNCFPHSPWFQRSQSGVDSGSGYWFCCLFWEAVLFGITAWAVRLFSHVKQQWKSCCFYSISVLHHRYQRME